MFHNHYARPIFGLVLMLVLSLTGSGEAQSEFQLQPITTTILCSSVETCTAAGLPNVKAATLRRPTTDVLAHSHVGIEITHDFSISINHAACSALAQRGYTTLCADDPFTTQFDYYGLEQVVPTVASAVTYLKSNVTSPAIDKVIIFGHSSGAPLQAFYENVAENSPSVCQGPEKLIPCVDTNLHNLPKADGVILFDAHFGLGAGQFTYTDPAIIVNADPPGNVPSNRDPALDMFLTANGYNFSTNGGDYSAKFVRNFLKAQEDRNQELLETALNLLQQERTATGNPNAMGDDIPFDIVAGAAARLWQADSGDSQQNIKGLLNCTQQPHVLLSHDGTRPFQIVCSVRPPSGNGTSGLSNAANVHLTVHKYLGMNTIRANGHYTQTIDDLRGIDWKSSATTTLVNVRGIGKHPNVNNRTTPLLIVANSGHYFIRFDEMIYDNAKTSDKTYAIEEGAVHGGTECTACEAILGLPQPSGPGTFGYFGDTQTRTYDFMTEWLNARF